jgi:hypothetical protein
MSLEVATPPLPGDMASCVFTASIKQVTQQSRSSFRMITSRTPQELPN